MASIATTDDPTTTSSRVSRLEKFSMGKSDGPYEMKEGEYILHEVEGVEVFLESEELCDGKPTGKGKLLLTNKSVVWKNLESLVQYSFPLTDVVLHAVCKDTASFPYKACVYCQIDVTTKEEASEDQYYSAEVRFAPTQGPNSPTPNGTETLTDSVELIFQAFSEGAKLNPDKANGEEGSTPRNPFEALASMMAMMGSSSTDLPNEQDPEENDTSASQRTAMLAHFDDMLSKSETNHKSIDDN